MSLSLPSAAAVSESVADIRRAGEIAALKARINLLIEISQRNLDKTMAGTTFVRLGDAIAVNEAISTKLAELFAALQALEPENT